MKGLEEVGRLPRLAACAAAVAVMVVSACGSTSAGSPTTLKPPTADMKPLSSIGAGEGALNLIDWPGYVDRTWTAPSVASFEQQSGCKVTVHDAQSSDEMVTLMAGGGGGQWDMVSASGDADLRLIYGGDVRPVNVNLIPDYTNFDDYFKNPPYNTIGGVHYGVSLQWGPNTLLYNKTKFANPPTSWSVLYDPANTGLITVYGYPIQIADAALYLSKKNPSLKITDPYELTQTQFDAVVNLLKQQKPLIKKYWGAASDEISLFENGDVMVGNAWPYQTNQLVADGKVQVADTIPQEGATGWGDTWMLATKAPHPNCAYMWLKFVSTPQVQAEQALSFGETPVNKLACAVMESTSPGSCKQYHADASAEYFSQIKFWKTPIAQCADGSQQCVTYDKWVAAWTSITA
jgi:putative spermidine/putrescine transport system substrate-binding protein